jgi:hypothetical protein
MVKSEVTSKKRKRGEHSDGDDSDAEDDTSIPLSSAVKKEKSEVKSEVKLEVIDMPAKKRKRDDSDGDEDVKNAISDRVNDASVRKKKKIKK